MAVALTLTGALLAFLLLEPFESGAPPAPRSSPDQAHAAELTGTRILTLRPGSSLDKKLKPATAVRKRSSSLMRSPR